MTECTRRAFPSKLPSDYERKELLGTDLNNQSIYLVDRVAVYVQVDTRFKDVPLSWLQYLHGITKAAIVEQLNKKQTC